MLWHLLVCMRTGSVVGWLSWAATPKGVDEIWSCGRTDQAAASTGKCIGWYRQQTEPHPALTDTYKVKSEVTPGEVSQGISSLDLWTQILLTVISHKVWSDLEIHVLGLGLFSC